MNDLQNLEQRQVKEKFVLPLNQIQLQLPKDKKYQSIHKDFEFIKAKILMLAGTTP